MFVAKYDANFNHKGCESVGNPISLPDFPLQ